MAIELIYCAAGNRRFAEIAIAAGFLYGAQVPNTVYFPPWFCDQDWRRPSRARYMADLAQYRPHMASVLDLERPEQLPEVLGWAEEAADYIEVVMIIPKYSGAIQHLPRSIGGKPIRLGYSVPTLYGGTEVPLWEFGGWPVHLLGSSPQRQMALTRYLDVVSVDGSSHQAAAQKFGTIWQDGRWLPGLYTGQRDALYVAFEISCANIMAAWRALS